MSAKLIVASGSEAGREIKLNTGRRYTLGRAETNSIRLSDPRVSRLHCVLDVRSWGVSIEDAGSVGGTLVGGKRVAGAQQLKSGDDIRIGDSRFRFESDVRVVAKPVKGPPASSMSNKSISDLVGQALGHFRLKRQMHVGKSGILFEALDQKHERPAIVKVLLPSVTRNAEERARFVRAVHTMIDVRHNNLVEIYGAGQQGQFCWCAMEFVDGISITELIELVGTQGKLDWREVYRIAVHVARALEYAHERKIIHRNVTPDNLLRRRNDQVVKLCDLALAKALVGTQSRQVTAPGQLVGSVAYMSPERTIDTSHLDWRSDQYGLGATLFALLTGRPPFESKTLPELVRAVRSNVPEFPQEVQQETCPEFLQLILRMLSKAPDDRILFTSDMMRQLDDIGKAYNVDADISFDR